MMTGIALMIRGPGHNFGGAWEFVVAVLLIIVVIFFRVYGPRKRSGPRVTHHRTAQNRAPEHAPLRAARSAITLALPARRLNNSRRFHPGRSRDGRSRYGYRDD